MAWFRCRERRGGLERLVVAPSASKAAVYAVDLGLKAPVDCEEYTMVLAARMMTVAAETVGVAAEILGDEQMKREAAALKRESYNILREARQKLKKPQAEARG